MNYKGLTLVELLISIGVLGLAVGVTAGILVAVVKSYQRSSLYDEIRHNGGLILGIFEENMKSARRISCKDVDCKVIVFDDKNLQRKEMGYHSADTSPTSCTVDGGNGYFYIRDYTTDPLSDPEDYEKVTNDESSSGINVSDVVFSINSAADKDIISLTFKISNSNCNKIVERVEEFSSLVIPRVY
jgi:hypothetical protein